MIFGILPVRRSHEATYGKIESRGAKLALVRAIRKEVHGFIVLPRVLEDMGDGSVDFGVPAPAFFIGGPSRITDTGQYQAMFDARGLLFVQTQPGDGADGSRNK